MKALLLFLGSTALILSWPLIGQDQQTDDQEKGTLEAVPVDSLPETLTWGEAPQGFSEPPPVPESNPMTHEKVKLGRRLFFDPILSRDGTVACASCHRPEEGFASSDTRAVGIEGKLGQRNAPSILNRAYGKNFLWDGSSTTLEEQALTPIENPDEFGNEIPKVIEALNASESYRQEFADAFGQSPDEAVTPENLAKAIASFERTLLTGNSGVDRFRASEYSALSREARQGMWIFESAGGCWKCHGGENFTDDEFHNTGVDFGNPNRDLGRAEVSKDPADNHKFKTPSLRSVSLTAPYMHDGSIKTLKEVVEFYNRGGSPDDPGLDKDIQPLNLSEKEIGFLVEFLKALTEQQ